MLKMRVLKTNAEKARTKAIRKKQFGSCSLNLIRIESLSNSNPYINCIFKIFGILGEFMDTVRHASHWIIMDNYNIGLSLRVKAA